MKFSLFLLTAIITGLTPITYAKRSAPKPAKAILNAGLRYEAIYWSSESEKLKQNGGFVRVINARNNLPICTKQVYETKYDQNLETDIQDNFITKLQIKGNSLLISSEKLATIEKPLANFCD